MSKKLISLDELNRFKQKEDIEISKACGGLKGIYNTLSALQTAYPTGTKGAFLVTSNNHWYYWNGTQWADGGAYQVVEIPDRSIEENKIDFGAIEPYLIQGVVVGNLKPYLEKYGREEGYYYYNYNGQIIEAYSATAIYYNRILEVKPNTQYTFKEVRFLARLNADLTAYDTNHIQNATTVNSLGAKYLLLSVNQNTSPYDEFVISEGNVLNTSITLPNWLKTKLDIGEVKPLNIEGIKLNNLFDIAQQYGSDDNIYYNDNGTIVETIVAGYKSYIIPIEQNKTLYMTYARWAILLDSSLTPINTTNYQSITSVNTSTAQYILISIKPSLYPNNDYFVSYGAGGGEGYILPNWIKEQNAHSFKTHVDSLSANTILKLTNQIGTINSVLKEFDIFSANFKITTLTGFEIGFRTTDNDDSRHEYFVIDTTNISYYSYGTLQSQDAHGLTFVNTIQFLLTSNGLNSYNLVLISNGNTFEKTITFNLSNNGYFYLKSLNDITDIYLNYSNRRLNKDIVIFGDSYMGLTNPDRWVYYLGKYKFTNVLVNGFAGENSYTALTNFRSLLSIKKPKTIIWALGMNDGNDTDLTTPSSQWLTVIEIVKTQCNFYGIDLILCTIPNVPSVDNRGKNYYVRNSGLRYIDFAKAVGSDNNTNWYSGMLSGDNVHPTEQGALTLFMQAISDVPELTIDK